MSRRFLQVLGLAILIVGIAFALKMSGDLFTKVTQAEGPTLMTTWGDPDLQGIWREDYETPLQRPAIFAGKEFVTDEERAELDRIRAAAPIDNDVGIAPRGSEQDVSGAYNSVFRSVRPTGRRTSLVVDPRDGRIPPMTPEAQNRRQAIREFELALLQATDTCRNKLPGCEGGKYGAPSPRRAETPPYYLATSAIGAGSINRADGPEDRSLAERCLSAVLPDFGGFRRIVQSRGAVAILYDTGQGQAWQRVIPVIDAPHLPPQVRQWWGGSRGHWEGDTLVVDITNFSPKTDFRGARENLHLTERWKRIDANTLEYTVTIDDTATWTRPWTVRQELNRQNEQANRIYAEPRCHEGNYGLTGLLLGARVEEKAFAEGRGPDPANRCTAGCGTGIEGLSDRDPLTR